MKRILTKNHIFLATALDIDTILAPLKKLGIIHFTYMANYPDGAQIYLSNNAKWIEDYYQLNLYETSSFEENPINYQSGYLLWQPDITTRVLVHGRQYHNSDNGITIIQKNHASCEFYFFSSAVENKAIVNFYINNLDILENFINYFKAKAEKILKKAENNKIYIPDHYAKLKKINQGKLLINYAEMRSEFLKEINSPEEEARFDQTYIKLDNIKFTRRQAQCLRCLIEGKSAKQTANSLNLSARTVEAYLENIKKKMHCKSKLALIGKLMTGYDSQYKKNELKLLFK